MSNIPDCMYDYRPEMSAAEKVAECKDCGRDIHEGEKYYNIGDHIICADCIRNYEKVGGEE